MRGIRFKLFLTLIKKTAKPVLSAVLCFLLVSFLAENTGGFFERLTIISAAAAMPQGSISVAAKYFAAETESDSTQSVTAEPIEKEESSSQVESDVTSSQSSSSSTSSSAPKEKPKDAGSISEYAFKASKTSSKIVWQGGAAFSNTSKVSNADIQKILKQTPEIKLTKGQPQVLIYHTHSTESYELEDLGYYTKGSSARTVDEKYNMLRVGDEIVRQLEAAGIGVIHDRSLYDYPSYNGAYNRSAATAKKYLEKYPSITVTLDIHRDAIEQSGGVRVKPTAVINGKKAAQVMIIAGVDDGTMDFPKWRENMKFASVLQQQMENSYPGLTRAAMVCHRRYNMYLTTNSLLIEMGGHANTLDEAVYSGEMLGKSLVEVLKEYGKIEENKKAPA
ncbi:MAG: stage II sporulation protein P [Oscillospiraceae bacterium]|nr:stage II sporulation protein P [Oscillospiraceae bacterium]